jgi:hypothetical protein
MFVIDEPFQKRQQTALMQSCSIDRSTLKFSLLAVLITGLFVVFLNGSSHPAIDPQLDNHFTPTLISVDGAGDSSSPDASVFVTSALQFPDGKFRDVFSASLDFIQPLRKPLKVATHSM